MKRFEVNVLRTVTRCYVMHIEAESEEKARDMALDQAGDVDFHDGSERAAEYAVESCDELAG